MEASLATWFGCLCGVFNMVESLDLRIKRQREMKALNCEDVFLIEKKDISYCNRIC